VVQSGYSRVYNEALEVGIITDEEWRAIKHGRDPRKTLSNGG
jgi:hypothetical protein